MPLVLTAIALALAIWIAFRINADFFKGKAPIFVLALCLFVVEVTYMLFARDSVAIMLCAEKSAAQPVQKAPAPPRSAASSP